MGRCRGPHEAKLQPPQRMQIIPPRHDSTRPSQALSATAGALCGIVGEKYGAGPGELGTGRVVMLTATSHDMGPIGELGRDGHGKEDEAELAQRSGWKEAAAHAPCHEAHVCVVRQEGSVQAWGRADDEGQVRSKSDVGAGRPLAGGGEGGGFAGLPWGARECAIARSGGRCPMETRSTLWGNQSAHDLVLGRGDGGHTYEKEQ